ncbi:recombinase family protein [Streptomyces sp. NPDC091416]|uniref:recombinase family protein n=1 Tax=Streptomyces sp. NPDC091416 TaxID=3366003 RepID=UPI003830FBCB
MSYPRQKLPQRAGIYCRLSYAPDGSLEKVERQEADCRALAERLGWTISEAHIFPDNSRSAWQRNRRRPQWDRMLQCVDNREIDGLLVYHGDRLIRQPYDLEKLISISDQQGMRVASPSGTRDLDSPDDRFILRIEAAQACRESDNTSRRVRRALTARRERGLTQSGGRRPFGYGVQVGTRSRPGPDGEWLEVPRYDTTQQVREEAELAADAADRLLAGQGQSGVVRWLNTRCTTTEGNPWTEKALRNVLTAPRAAGLIDHEGDLYEAAWDGFLSRETWESVRALYEASAEQSPYPGRERRYLLSGVGGAQCYNCGGYVRAKPVGGKNRKTSRVYYCHTCRKVGRNVEHLDAYVSGQAVALLNDSRFLAELTATAENPALADEVATLERRRSEVRRQLETLADHPEVDAGMALLALASFDEKIRSTRDRLAASASQRLIGRMAGITPTQWLATSIDVRSATVRALYGVVLLPTTLRGPGFDTNAVRVVRSRTDRASEAGTPKGG